MYMYPVKPDEIFHYGIPHRSGRYPYGSGDRPFQDRETRRALRNEAKREKNLKIGSERLVNRIDRANRLSDIDYLSRKVGWENTEKAAEAHKGIKNIKEVSREILEDEDRTVVLGNYTRKVRIADIAITSTSAATLAAAGTSFLVGTLELPIFAAALPVAGAGVIAKIGYDYFQKTKY